MRLLEPDVSLLLHNIYTFESKIKWKSLKNTRAPNPWQQRAESVHPSTFCQPSKAGEYARRIKRWKHLDPTVCPPQTSPCLIPPSASSSPSFPCVNFYKWQPFCRASLVRLNAPCRFSPRAFTFSNGNLLAGSAEETIFRTIDLIFCGFVLY